jgi:hypothetical protein
VNDDLDQAVEELLAVVAGRGRTPDTARIESLFGD